MEDGSVRNLRTFHPQLSGKGCHYIEGVSKDKLCLKNTSDFTKSQRQRRRQRQNDVMCALCMLEGYFQRFHVFVVTALASNHLFSRSQKTSNFVEWRKYITAYEKRAI